MGFNLDSYLTNAEHTAVDHSTFSGVGNLHNDGTGPASTVDHSMLSHTGIPGVGDLTTAAHAVLNHGSIPGIFNQVTTRTLNWVNNAAPVTTGALGFTPVFCMAIGVFSHTAAGGSLNFSTTANSTISVGMATGTGTNAFSVSQHCEDGGTSDEDTTTHDSSSIAGVSSVNSGAGTSHTVASVDVTSFSSAGITLDPTVNVTARITLLIVGTA